MAEGKKNRKIGRNIDSCRHYAASHRAEHNKLRRVKKHLKKFADDLVAIATVDRLKLALGMK